MAMNTAKKLHPTDNTYIVILTQLLNSAPVWIQQDEAISSRPLTLSCAFMHLAIQFGIINEKSHACGAVSHACATTVRNYSV